MRCPNCGKEILKTDKFCKWCGAMLRENNLDYKKEQIKKTTKINNHPNEFKNYTNNKINIGTEKIKFFYNTNILSEIKDKEIGKSFIIKTSKIDFILISLFVFLFLTILLTTLLILIATIIYNIFHINTSFLFFIWWIFEAILIVLIIDAYKFNNKTELIIGTKGFKYINNNQSYKKTIMYSDFEKIIIKYLPIYSLKFYCLLLKSIFSKKLKFLLNYYILIDNILYIRNKKFYEFVTSIIKGPEK